MSYVTHTLRFKDEAEFLSVWPYMEEGMAVYPAPSAVDIIGVSYRDDTPDGRPPVARTGYMVNLALPAGQPIHESLAPFVIPNPVNPVRVFA